MAQTRHDLLRRASRLPRPPEKLLRCELWRRRRRCRLPIRPVAPVWPPELPRALRRLLQHMRSRTHRWPHRLDAAGRLQPSHRRRLRLPFRLAARLGGVGRLRRAPLRLHATCELRGAVAACVATDSREERPAPLLVRLSPPLRRLCRRRPLLGSRGPGSVTATALVGHRRRSRDVDLRAAIGAAAVVLAGGIDARCHPAGAQLLLSRFLFLLPPP